MVLRLVEWTTIENSTMEQAIGTTVSKIRVKSSISIVFQLVNL